MHEGLDARVRVRLRGWAVASKLAGVAVGGGEGVSEVEGVPGAAARSLRRPKRVAMERQCHYYQANCACVSAARTIL